MPPRGSELYSQARGSIRDFGYDPRLAEDYAARQERLDAERLSQLAQMGAINAEGITNMGNAVAQGIDKGVQNYQNKQKLKLAEEEQAQQKKLSEAQIGKLTEETARLSDKQPLEWMPTNLSDKEGRPLTFNKVTGEYQPGNVTLGSKTAQITPYQAEMLKLAKEKADREAAKGRKSVGQEMLDKEFAKELNDWESGSSASLDKNLGLLEGAKKELATMPDTRGILGFGKRSTGRLPDELKNPKAVQIRNDVRAAAQGALKAALGSSFTEREGERIMDAAYDDNLPPAENLKKIDRAIAEITAKKNSMESRAKHFRAQGGTLAGFAAPAIATELPPPPPPPPSGGDGSAFAGTKPVIPIGTLKTISGVPMIKVEGGWIPAPQAGP